MGFGQRVYRTRDPRADVLKGIVRDLKESNGVRKRGVVRIRCSISEPSFGH